MLIVNHYCSDRAGKEAVLTKELVSRGLALQSQTPEKKTEEARKMDLGSVNRVRHNTIIKSGS